MRANKHGTVMLLVVLSLTILGGVMVNASSQSDAVGNGLSDEYREDISANSKDINEQELYTDSLSDTHYPSQGVDDKDYTDGGEGERRIGVDDTDPSPTGNDLDGDSLTDSPETDVTTPVDDGTTDTDGERSEDSEKWPADTDPTGDSGAPGSSGRDSDGDGLTDEHERDLGTDPNDSDTDGDGFTDAIETSPPDWLPNPSPTRQDVYVEIDYNNPNCTLPRSQARTIVDRFESAPVDNPDGSTGIHLHLIYDEEVPASTVNVSGFNQTLQTLYSDHFDHRTQGYHYAVIGSEVVWKGDDWYTGVAYYEQNAFTAECESSEETGHVFMHELGHSLGLSPGDHLGIDSFQFRPDEYPSMMNYNTSGDLYRFSTGDAGPNDFDDWGHIEQHMIPPETNVSSR